MDLSEPTLAVVPTLDGPVLQVLLREGRPLTAGQVAQETSRGSLMGIRNVLRRLAEQGIVVEQLMGANKVYSFNGEHILAEAVRGLCDARYRLWNKIRAHCETWDIPPVEVAVFGSAARADGDAQSDIDLLLVYPRALDDDQQAYDFWQSDVDRLGDQVQVWTGNHVQVLAFSDDAWRTGKGMTAELRANIKRDAIVLLDPVRLPSGSLRSR